MKRRPSVQALTFVIIALMVSCKRGEGPVRVVATSEVAATGIAQYLADAFRKQTGVNVDLQTAGNAKIPGIVQQRNADVILVSDPSVVRSLEQQGAVSLRSPFAFDDFVIAGPRSDPAHVRSAATAAGAFRSIAKHDRAFCAPAGVPRLHRREEALWAAAGVDPAENKRYRECKGDAAAVLREASRRQAYTLTDRASIDSGERTHLRALLRGVPMLHDSFMIVLLHVKRPNPNAEWMLQWVMSFRGREAIEAFRGEGGAQLYVSE